MTSDYASMWRTAAQVQGAMIGTWLDLAARGLRLATAEAQVLAEVAARPCRVAAEQRQTAVEDAVWAFYAGHAQLLRALSGAPGLAAMIFLNQLDLRRGPRAAPDADDAGMPQPD